MDYLRICLMSIIFTVVGLSVFCYFSKPIDDTLTSIDAMAAPKEGSIYQLSDTTVTIQLIYSDSIYAFKQSGKWTIKGDVTKIIEMLIESRDRAIDDEIKAYDELYRMKNQGVSQREPAIEYSI